MDPDLNSFAGQLNGSFLDQQMRRTDRNLILAGLLLIAGVLAYGGVEWRYFYNFFLGPFDADANSLESTERFGPDLRFFVRVRGDEASDTGVQEIEEKIVPGTVRRVSVKAKYSVLFIGKRLLIVKTRPDEAATVYQGVLVGLPADLRFEVVGPLLAQYPDAGQAFLPLMLDATGFRQDGYIALTICVPTLMFALGLIRKAMTRKNAPAIHPVVQAASCYGSLADTAHQLDADLRGDTGKFGKAKVTNSWVLLPRPFGIAMCHIPNLVWAYKKVTKHYHYFIPIGKSYAVILYDRYGKPLQLQTSQKKIDVLLSLLVERAPWAVFGYTEDLEQTLRTNWRGFVAAVDARRPGATPGSLA